MLFKVIFSVGFKIATLCDRAETSIVFFFFFGTLSDNRRNAGPGNVKFPTKTGQKRVMYCL